MSEVTDLHILAKMANGSPNEEDAFVIRNPTTEKVLVKIHNLSDLIDVLGSLEPETIFPSLCRSDGNEEVECDIALWVHYVLGDAVLSAKIFNLVNELQDDPVQLKLQVFNLCFNRYLNFQEILEFSDDIAPFEEESAEPTHL